MAKIIHVVESFGAGTLSIVSALANRQAQDGHSVFVLHALREETPTHWRDLFDDRIELLLLPMIRAISPAADFNAGRMLLAELKRIKPDVVHLHSSKAGALGRIVSLIYRRARWFFSPHGLSFLQKAEGRIKNTIFLLIEKLLAQIPVTFIACSPSEGEEIRQNLTHRVIVVKNAVDLTSIPLAPGNDGVVRIGTVGRVALARNPELFAEVAARLSRPGVEFVWIGGGDESGEAALKNAGVETSGWIDRAEALRRLATLDIYIQTSRWEGLPVAVIEAMAAGLPVVATHVVGNRDLVRHGENGWLVADADGFVEKLQPLIENAAQRREFGAKARDFAQTHYSLDRMMGEIYRVYGV